MSQLSCCIFCVYGPFPGGLEFIFLSFFLLKLLRGAKSFLFKKNFYFFVVKIILKFYIAKNFKKFFAWRRKFGQSSSLRFIILVLTRRVCINKLTLIIEQVECKRSPSNAGNVDVDWSRMDIFILPHIMRGAKKKI